MVSKADLAENNSGDTIKLIGAGLLTLAGLVAFYAFSEFSLLLRVIGLLLVAAAVAFIIYQTARGKRTVGFFRDARTEVRKVVWPSRAETTQTTLTVLVIVLIVGVFLWLLDSILARLFRLITGIGE